MTEKSLDEIMSERDAPVQIDDNNAPEAVEPSAEQRARDEAGRFAAEKAAEPSDRAAAAVVEGTDTHEGGLVPQQALHAERQKVKAERERAEKLDRENAELRGRAAAFAEMRPQTPAVQAEPPKPPDFWEDPSKYVESALSPFQEELRQTRFLYSQRDAFREHGKETVAAAEEALKQACKSGAMNPASVKAQLARSLDPVGDVVNWHLNSPQTKEASLREQIRAEILAEQEKLAENVPETQQPAPPRPNMPSNFSSARSDGPRSAPTFSGPKPLSEIMAR